MLSLMEKGRALTFITKIQGILDPHVFPLASWIDALPVLLRACCLLFSMYACPRHFADPCALRQCYGYVLEGSTDRRAIISMGLNILCCNGSVCSVFLASSKVSKY
jgi:hypothetical protein